jgi:hypothetical protein
MDAVCEPSRGSLDTGEIVARLEEGRERTERHRRGHVSPAASPQGPKFLKQHGVVFLNRGLRTELNFVTPEGKALIYIFFTMPMIHYNTTIYSLQSSNLESICDIPYVHVLLQQSPPVPLGPMTAFFLCCRDAARAGGRAGSCAVLRAAVDRAHQAHCQPDPRAEQAEVCRGTGRREVLSTENLSVGWAVG